MRKLFLPLLFVGFAVCAGPASAFAQAPDAAARLLEATTPEQRAQIRTDRMKQALGLDAAQVEKVGAINLKYAKEANEILAGPAADRPGKLEAMSKRKDEELKGVLSAEQFQKYEAAREGWRAKAAEAAGEATAAKQKAKKAESAGTPESP